VRRGAEPAALARRDAHARAGDAAALQAEVDVTDELLELWEFPESFDLGSITIIAQDQRTPADARAKLVSSRGDIITVQLVDGRLTEHVDLRVYVRGRGAFEVLRREVWPGGRVLVTLSAWPARAG
jgi:hypothetical protein